MGADEDADAMLRLGVKIAQGFAVPVYYETVRGQRMQRSLASGIVGDLNTKTGGGQIKTILFKGWPALRLDSVRDGGARQQHDGCKQAQGPEAVDQFEADDITTTDPSGRVTDKTFDDFAGQKGDLSGVRAILGLE